MALLKATYGSADDIPEGYADLYTERDGQYELTEVEGMRPESDSARLQTTLKKERDDHKKTKGDLKKWAGLDAEEIHAKLDRFDELEAAATGKLDDAAIDELVEKRIGSRLNPIQRENAKLKDANEELETANGELSGTITRGKINDVVRKAATEASCVTTAHTDILMRAERLFEVADGDKIIARDNVDVAPGLLPDQWLADMREVCPHWWPASQGGGAKGNDGNQGGFAKNPFSDAHWNLTDQALAVRADRAKADRMAAAAGTTVGGPRPVKAA